MAIDKSAKSQAEREEYIYIVQASLEQGKCKIGITDNLLRRLREYNNATGKSKDNVYQYIFTCAVRNMQRFENDIKKEFKILRESNGREIYFYNESLFDKYVAFIKNHKSFVKEIFIKQPPVFRTGFDKKSINRFLYPA